MKEVRKQEDTREGYQKRKEGEKPRKRVKGGARIKSRTTRDGKKKE